MIKNWLLTNLKFIVYSILYSIYYKEPPTIYINEDLPFFLASLKFQHFPVVMTSKKYLYINKISYWSTQSKFCIYELTFIPNLLPCWTRRFVDFFIKGAPTRWNLQITKKTYLKKTLKVICFYSNSCFSNNSVHYVNVTNIFKSSVLLRNCDDIYRTLNNVFLNLEGNIFSLYSCSDIWFRQIK